MRIISILLGLVLLALIVSKQLNGNVLSDEVQGTVGGSTPVVPTAPDGVKDFGTDMNQFMEDANVQRNKYLEETLGK